MRAERLSARHSHVGLIVSELAPAVGFYVGLTGASAVHLMEIPEFGIRNAFIAAGPEVYLEVIEAPAGRPVRVLGEDHGPCQQILAMETADLDSTIARLRDQGTEVADLPPTPTLPFPRAWITRAARGDLPMELLPAGAVAQLIGGCEVRDPEEFIARAAR